MNFDWGFALEILPELGPALWITVQATAAGTSIALTLGLVLALMRRSRTPLLAWAAAGFVEFVRSTPLLVQLYFLFYVLPDLGFKLSPFATGALGLGLHYSTYCSEVYRAGIESIPRGQWEAAAALNLSGMRTLTHIIVPQAIPPVIPALGNYVIAMFKDTPLLSAITVLELLQTAKIIGAETFRYVEPLTLVGLLFLAMSLASAAAIRRLEGRLRQEA